MTAEKNDVIAKAWRAQQLGFRLMIDFHYSDSWADPAHQTVPAAWQGYTAEQMKQAVADHTKDVLKCFGLSFHFLFLSYSSLIFHSLMVRWVLSKLIPTFTNRLPSE